MNIIVLRFCLFHFPWLVDVPIVEFTLHSYGAPSSLPIFIEICERMNCVLLCMSKIFVNNNNNDNFSLKCWIQFWIWSKRLSFTINLAAKCLITFNSSWRFTWLFQASFRLYLVFSKKKIFLQTNKCEILSSYLASSAGIQTHNLSTMSLFPWPFDLGSHSLTASYG